MQGPHIKSRKKCTKYSLPRSVPAEGMKEVSVRPFRAFMDMPGVSAALGFPVGTYACDITTSAVLLSNMKSAFESTLSTNGTRFAAQRSVAEAAASTVYGPEMNSSSVLRVTGISAELFAKGGILRAANSDVDPSAALSSMPISRHHVYPVDRVHAWYHSPECT